MSVTILNVAQKMQAALSVSQGDSLTSVAKRLGVSRQTIRRVVDEFDRVGQREVGNDGYATINKSNNPYGFADTMDFNQTFKVTKTVDADKVQLFLIQGADLLEAGGVYFKPQESYTFYREELDFVEDLEEETQEPHKFRVGDTVTLSQLSEFWTEYPNSSNPKGIEGVITEILDGRSILRLRVDWADGTCNSYNDGDLFLVEEAEVDTANYFFSATQDSISMVRVCEENGVETRNINKSSGQFSELRDLLVQDTSEATLRHVFIMMDTCAVVEAFSIGRIKIDVESEVVVFVKRDGTERPVPTELSMDIITTVKTYGKDRSEPLVKFLDKLMNNPSFQAIEGLYRFMKHNCIEINDDGSIQAWKGVRSDLYDKHSGTIFNGNFGEEIGVDRSEVDDNPDQTCSYGLHVGNREYATMWGEVLLCVKVQPYDVVAVPKDYNGAKMRCCAYTPLEIVSN